MRAEGLFPMKNACNDRRTSLGRFICRSVGSHAGVWSRNFSYEEVEAKHGR